MRRIAPLRTALSGSFRAPPDKSIAHRAALFSALAHGTAVLSRYSRAEDCRSTVRCLAALGVPLSWDGDTLTLTGRGRAAWTSPSAPLDCGNSGTTARMLLGAIAGAPELRATLIGDASLSRRPMQRVAAPLRAMGAQVDGDTLPLSITGASLQAVSLDDPKSSAQVKTALLLAGLAAKGRARYRSPAPSRDHSERMLRAMGADLRAEDTGWISIGPGELRALDLSIPGDPSGAAFLLGAAAILPGSRLRALDLCLNPSRLGFYDVLRRMGADVQISPQEQAGPEPVGSIEVTHAPLRGVSVHSHEVPSMIDELPLLAVLATQAEGETRVEGAAELRVKESDRIALVCRHLRALGAQVEEKPDGFVITGPTRLGGAAIDPEGDHRIAMSFAIAGLAGEGVALHDADCAAVSYPSFFDDLARASHEDAP